MSAPMTARELLAVHFTEPRWAIPGLIPEGLFLIAAKPKMGKSWLMLNLAVAVAAGGRALGHAYVDAGDVLYLALEDTPRRLQQRLVIMLEDGAEAPDGLELATSWRRLDDGGLPAIDAWLAAHPDARLVIIDTLAKIRGKPKHRETSLYDDDYAALAGLKELADRHGVAIGVVHHQRKLSAEDPLDTISGTLGLSAGPDTILVLTRARGAADAVLHVTGRDVEEAEHALKWDAAVGTWALLEGLPANASGERIEVLRALQESTAPLRPSEMATWIGRTKGSVRKLMWEMANDGQLGGDGVGGYFLPVLTTTTRVTRVMEVTPVTGNTGNGGNTHG